MTAIRQTMIYCDGDEDSCPMENCPWGGGDGSFHLMPVANQRLEMKTEGWKRIAGKDYCPHCAKENHERR